MKNATFSSKLWWMKCSQDVIAYMQNWWTIDNEQKCANIISHLAISFSRHGIEYYWKDTISGVHVSPGSAEKLVRRGGITNHHLIAYSHSIIEVIVCYISVVFETQCTGHFASWTTKCVSFNIHDTLLDKFF